MRQWSSPRQSGNEGRAIGAVSAPFAGPAEVLGGMIARLGEPGFDTGVLECLHPLMPAASWSVYRTGAQCRPTLYLSAALGIPDTTRDCWWAYLSGPYRHDHTWGRGEREADAPLRLCHITAQEVGGEHQARVYEAHGMAERVSIFEPEATGAVFAVNFYRHQHQPAFSDGQIAAFENLAPALLALARKHIALTGESTAWRSRSASAARSAPRSPPSPAPALLRQKLCEADVGLTPRELDVCVRLLQGMTQEGIACDLGLSVPTVKTYRNRAFARLGGLHFRNELFALVLRPH